MTNHKLVVAAVGGNSLSSTKRTWAALTPGHVEHEA